MTILIIAHPSSRSPSLHEKSRENYKPLAHIRALFLESVPEVFQKSREVHKTSSTPRSLILPSVPEVFQESREPHKTSSTPRSLILPSVPEVFKKPEKPIKFWYTQAPHSPRCSRITRVSVSDQRSAAW